MCLNIQLGADPIPVSQFYKRAQHLFELTYQNFGTAAAGLTDEKQEDVHRQFHDIKT